MDLVGVVGTLDAFSGAYGRARPYSTLAKSAKQFAPQRVCQSLCAIFLQIETICKTVRKIARLVQRQSQNSPKSNTK